MCGIAGFTEYSQRFGGEQALERMGESIAHRGPDAHGIYHQKNIGLCHRRLSIIDLSEAGKQPMLSHDGEYIIVFNGEIYNYQTLRQELLDEGCPFFSHSDTEVILALYARDGKKMLDKINGQFAFAIWDKINESLFIARDRIGKKPLYYHQIDNDIVFASELKALLCLKQIPRNIRLDAVHDFFAYQYIPDPKTIFENIYKLEPGHYLEIDKNGISKHQYWDISFSQQSQSSEAQLKTELQAMIKQCTTSRMISDVPLGAFLSGGVDSSGIVATMAKNSEQPITTCSIGFDTKQFNETEFAQQVANQYHTDHHEYIVHENVKDNLKKIVSYFDEPFADPSLVPTYFVSQLARQKVTVAIAGDGGDEVFAGYEKYSIDHIENKLRNMIPKLIRKNLFPPIESILSKFNFKLCKKAVTLLNSLQQDAAMGFYLSNAQITDKDWRYITSDKTRKALGDYHPSTITTGFYERCDGPDHLAKILYTDMKTYLPGGILVKVDRTSMANSLEVRAPILDYQLIEFAATIPSALKFNQGEKKYILKEAFKDDLPDDILYRKKMGFSVPLAQWLREEIKELTESTLFQATAGLPDYFDMGHIRKMWDQHQQGQKDNATVLWSMLMFQLWWDEYMGETKQAA
jgi:asparagine synthase (glutamine-hydrolysing)